MDKKEKVVQGRSWIREDNQINQYNGRTSAGDRGNE